MKTTRILLCILAMTFLLGVSAAYAEDEDFSEKKKTSGPPPEFEYLQMKPLMVPVITSRGLTEQVSLLVSLEIPYGKTGDIKAMEPKLADAYISDLYGALSSGGVMMQGGIVNVQAIKDHLTKDTEQVLGPDKVHAVLLQVVQQSKR